MWTATGYLNADDDVAFDRHSDACNCFGHSYKQWYRALARHPVTPELTIWFPRLYQNPEWQNVLSDDEETIYETRIQDNDGYVQEALSRPDRFKRMVFVGVLGPDRKVTYHFKGLYEIDLKTSLNTSTITYRRKEKRVNDLRESLTGVNAQLKIVHPKEVMRIINLFLISSIIFLAGCHTSNSPSKAALKYQELSDSGDFDGAIGLLSERKIRTLGIGQMKQSLIGINEKARLLGEQHTFQIIREDIVGDLAEVDIRVLVKIKDRADTSHVITHKLIKENAQWKIDGFNLNE